ncbi:hypothetical protein J6590_037283, partial [Homalodisca vitripennis]
LMLRGEAYDGYKWSTHSGDGCKGRRPIHRKRLAHVRFKWDGVLPDYQGSPYTLTYFIAKVKDTVLETMGNAKVRLTLNVPINGLAEQVGCFPGQNRPALTHPSSSYDRRCLIQLSCDNRCTRYNVPLGVEVM